MWIYKDIRIENSNYKKENIEINYLKNVRKNHFLKIKNSLLKLGKDFIELKDRKLKERKVKIKREMEELFFKLIFVSIDDMDMLEQKEIKNIRPIKDTWSDWLINYILEPITKGLGLFKDKILRFFKTKTLKQAVYGRGKKLSKLKRQSKVNNIRNPFILRKKRKLRIE